MISDLRDWYTAKTVITKFPSDALVGSGRRTTTLRCLAVTDQLTSLRIQWIADNNASDNCASWRTVDERQQQVLVELDQSHTCCAVTCSVSNGLSKDSSSARVCWANGTRTIFTGYRHGTRSCLVFLTTVMVDSFCCAVRCISAAYAVA